MVVVVVGGWNAEVNVPIVDENVLDPSKIPSRLLRFFPIILQLKS